MRRDGARRLELAAVPLYYPNGRWASLSDILIEVADGESQPIFMGG